MKSTNGMRSTDVYTVACATGIQPNERTNNNRAQTPRGLSFTIQGECEHCTYNIVISDMGVQWAVNRGNGWQSWSNKKATGAFFASKLDDLRRLCEALPPVKILPRSLASYL